MWFAWKIVLLQYRKQPTAMLHQFALSCDLLEKSYFCSIANNNVNNDSHSLCVVICLKNRTFAVSQTTISCIWAVAALLWFAWKIVLLQYRKQPGVGRYDWRQGCDLLEKSYFCSIANNPEVWQGCDAQLWFAWKIVLLQYRKQQWGHLCISPKSCDLLEKSYFCSIANNKNLLCLLDGIVVICLKNRTFAVSQTTCSFAANEPFQLWFAWKIVLLQYRKQPNSPSAFLNLRCDLLEKSYFCSIANNLKTLINHFILVVICLKNRTFAVSQTTRVSALIFWYSLWFAWKIVLLQYRKQQ